MRAVGFRRRCFTLDVALRYRFALSLEHYYIFIDWAPYVLSKSNHSVSSRLVAGRIIT